MDMDVAEVDAWCCKQLDRLSAQMYPYLLAGGSLSDPQYRQQLGQHQAFMRMRSYLSGARRAFLQAALEDKLEG